MVISLLALRRGERHFDAESSPEALGLNLEVFRHPVQVHVEARRQTNGWLLQLKAVTRVHRCCDRCGIDQDVAHASDEEALLVLEGETPASFDDDEGWLRVRPEEERIDLDQALRDAILTALPDRFFCRDDCRGLCDQCGQDLNEGSCDCRRPAHDSPFAGLARLKRDEDSE
jgi:uncharacterized protein